MTRFTYTDRMAVEAGEPLFITEIESAAGRYLALLGWDTVLEYMDDLMVVGEPVEMDLREPVLEF